MFLASAGAGSAALAAGGAGWYAYDEQSLYAQADGPYSAWSEWKEATATGPAALLRSAVLASSPHNTQPWPFRVGESSVELFLDPRHSVAGLDPFLREAYIGMGCALENLALAAGAQGFAERAIAPDGCLSLQPVETLRMVARVDLTPGTRRETELWAVIPNRHTNRGLYDPSRELPTGFVEELRAINEADARVFGVAARPCNEAVEMVDYERSRVRPARRLGELAEVIGKAGWEPTFMFLMGWATQQARLSPRRGVGRVML
jgi:hypothetical protein